MIENIILDIGNLFVEFRTPYGTVHAVNGISFSLNKGETLGIVGESGCGKSVSMLSVMRLLPEPPAKVSADRISFLGKDLQKITLSDMQKIRGNQIAMIFQDPMTAFTPVLTIGHQLKEPLRVHFNMSDEEAEERSTELLELVGIPDARDRLKDYPHQFSGGMRQRAMIAMALACNPTLLIADEPTTALDVTIQAQIVDLIQSIQKEFSMTLIWITHDLGVVAGLTERVIVFYAGYIMEDAPVDDLYERPLHPYTTALLSSLPEMGGQKNKRLETIKGLPPDLLKLPEGCPFSLRCKFAKEKCFVQRPLLLELEPNHKAACWIDITTGVFR